MLRGSLRAAFQGLAGRGSIDTQMRTVRKPTSVQLSPLNINNRHSLYALFLSLFLNSPSRAFNRADLCKPFLYRGTVNTPFDDRAAVSSVADLTSEAKRPARTIKLGRLSTMAVFFLNPIIQDTDEVHFLNLLVPRAKTNESLQDSRLEVSDSDDFLPDSRGYECPGLALLGLLAFLLQT